ncbi:MAG: 30S ribosomal protein S12 methylthiotransferase RimO [Bacilli bacterium]|nr:30S ribosomal protein S12 methylthiotransferase RimO [Bacilli bacterium]MBN2696576.1 30S ribosomal protein S12 methylthiotransferase RimO [Bacilli bacterium]
MKIGLVSLGCAKNLVDSEFILGVLKSAGAEIVNDPETADAIIVNTCGFIESAKEETIDTIREMAEYGKKLIVCGCYAERYEKQLKAEMPFIDRIITLSEYPKIHLIFNEIFANTSLSFHPLRYENRVLTSSHHAAYVKISEGCDNLCTFCAIPMIRGKFHSRDYAEIIAECNALVKSGIKEISLIGQDTTRYGQDLETKHDLTDLLQDISKIEGLFLVRVLYLYPHDITDKLIDEIASNPKVAKYFDVPIQHFSDRMLRRMNRRGKRSDIEELFKKIRERVPEAIIRTTLIVGFPGETEAEFTEMLDFVRLFGFDRLGVFTYSREEDTPAYKLDGQLPEAIKQDRFERLMKVQKPIARRKNKSQIGKLHATLVESYDPETNFYYGRSYAFAPDDIDGYIVFQSQKEIAVGDIVNVMIKEAIMYDLIGDAVV